MLYITIYVPVLYGDTIENKTWYFYLLLIIITKLNNLSYTLIQNNKSGTNYKDEKINQT